jgi:hypothetical protein
MSLSQRNEAGIAYVTSLEKNIKLLKINLIYCVRWAAGAVFPSYLEMKYYCFSALCLKIHAIFFKSFLILHLSFVLTARSLLKDDIRYIGLGGCFLLKDHLRYIGLAGAFF